MTREEQLAKRQRLLDAIQREQQQQKPRSLEEAYESYDQGRRMMGASRPQSEKTQTSTPKP